MKKYTLIILVIIFGFSQTNFAQETGSLIYLRQALEIQLKSRLVPHSGIIPHKGPFYVVIDELYDVKKLDLDLYKGFNVFYLTEEELEEKPRNEIDGYYKIAPIFLKGDEIFFNIIHFSTNFDKDGVRFLQGTRSSFQLLSNCESPKNNFSLVTISGIP